MTISEWRLPEELGGAVVNPVRCEGVISAQAKFAVQVPGTNYRIYVPSECLVPVLPVEPPVNSVVLVLGIVRRNWQLYVRQSVGAGGAPGRWSAPGNSGVVHTWQEIHQNWEQVHVLLWWDEGRAEEGVSVPSGRGPHSLVVQESDDEEAGIATLRIADGMARYAHLDRRGAIQVAAALLTLAMKDRM